MKPPTPTARREMNHVIERHVAFTRDTFPRTPTEKRLADAESEIYTWLLERGFDPKGNLREAIKSKRNKFVVSTAMLEACLAGRHLISSLFV